MIVAYNALSVRPGVDDGAATYSVNLLHRLPAALPEARIVVYARTGEQRLEGVDGLEVEHVDVSGAAGRVLRETLALSGRLRRSGAAVLLSPNESIPLRPPCPVVVVAQNLVYHRQDETSFTGADRVARAVTRAQFAYYRGRMVSAYRRADAVVAVSAETARVLAARSRLDLAKTIVVHEGADSVLLPAPRLDRAREPRLVIVSTLAPYKNHDRALEAFALVRRAHPELMLDIVGGDWRGYERVVRACVDRLGLRDAVRLRGAVAGAAVADLYETSLALVHLSGCESFGLPAVEAMRYGLPVVAAARSSLPEVLGPAAAYADPGDPTAVAELLIELVAKPAARADLSRRGITRAAELTWAATAAGVARVLRAAVGRTRVPLGGSV